MATSIYEVKVVSESGEKLVLTAIGAKAYHKLTLQLMLADIDFEDCAHPISAYRSDQVEKALDSAKEFVEQRKL